VERGARKDAVVSGAWLLAFGMASSLVWVTAAHRIGATFDEPLYLRSGLTAWRGEGGHRLVLRVGTPPLVFDVQALPLYLAERWRGRPWDLDADAVFLLPWFRTGNLAFWWLLLLYAHLLGGRLAGPWGGRLAVALLACEPNLLAHAGVGTADIGVTACLLALTYHFLTGRGRRWPLRVGLPMMLYGVALAAKSSALVFGPICLLAVELDRLCRTSTPSPYPLPRGGEGRVRGMERPAAETWRERLRRWRDELRPLVRELVQIGIGGFLVSLVLCGCDFQPEPSFVAWAHRLPEGGWRTVMVWLSEHLCVFSNGAEALVRQVRHNLHGHSTYLLGVGNPRSLWYYYPVLWTIKLPVALLLLPLLLAVLRPRCLLNLPLLIAAALLLFSLNCRVQIGIRLQLLAVTMTGIGLAVAIAEAVRDQGALWRRRALAVLAGAAVAWMGVASLTSWPNGLCYVNELWGGCRAGYALVSDSNYDWGQGLPELAEWQCRHADAPLDVWYFGTDPLLRRLPVTVVPFHDLPIDRPEAVPRYLHGRLLAVGTSLVYGQGLTVAHQQAAAFLRRYRPIDRTTTFLIYDLRARSN
jgi:hypothetical protein